MTCPWPAHVERLARWFTERMVNRVDVYGRYLAGGGSITAPARHRRGKDKLTFNDLYNHAAGRVTLGAHSTSADDRCKWLAWDIDAHNDADDPAANWRDAASLAETCASAGLDVLVEDSNNHGGYHAWCLFSETIPAELAYRAARWLAARAGVSGRECFPKQPSVRGGCGNYLRLPGRHHKRPHFSRFFDLDDERWLEGPTAAEFILAAPVNDADALEELRPVLPPLPTPTEPTEFKAWSGRLPACIRDILETGIRKRGQRNAATLAVSRFCKAAGLPIATAVAYCVRLTMKARAGGLTSNLSDDEIRTNCESVARSVYGGAYPFECWHALRLGTRERPVECAGPACPLVVVEVPTVAERRVTLPVVDDKARGVACSYV